MAKKPKGQAHQFIVKPPNGRLYFIARIFKTREDLQAYAGSHEVIALVRSYKKRVIEDGERVISSEAGEVCFCYGHLDIDTVAHESAHMAVALFIRRRKPIVGKDKGQWVSDEEEEFSTLVGKIVAQIETKLRKLELK